MKHKKYSQRTVIMASVVLGIFVCGIFSLVSLSGTEKNPSSEMKSEIQALVSEKLALDMQDIRIDYMDVETFTSPDTQDIYLD